MYTETRRTRARISQMRTRVRVDVHGWDGKALGMKGVGIARQRKEGRQRFCDGNLAKEEGMYGREEREGDGMEEGNAGTVVEESLQSKSLITKSIHLSLSLMLSGTYVSALRYNSRASWRLPLRQKECQVATTKYRKEHTFPNANEQERHMLVLSACGRQATGRLPSGPLGLNSPWNH